MNWIDAVLLAIAMTAATYFISDRLSRMMKARVDDREERAGHLREIRMDLAACKKALEDAALSRSGQNDVLARVPELVAGLQEMCREFASRTDALNKTVEILEASLSPGESTYEEYAEDTPTARKAANEQEIRDLMRRGGVSREDAEARVKERRVYDHLRG